jgi:putative transposase
LPRRGFAARRSPARSTLFRGGFEAQDDADHLIDKVSQTGAETVIPPKLNRKVQRSYDIDLYKERNIIERFFNKLKQFRRVAPRYDKLLVNFMGFVKLAAIAIWLR